ncbi:hypothetical protein WDW37_02980 [Bdellovibrionota bacterium FG-1]
MKNLILITVVGLFMIAPAHARDNADAGPGAGLCAKVSVDGEMVPVTSPKGKKAPGIGDISAKLTQQPDQKWMQSLRANKNYHVFVKPFEDATYPDGHVEHRPARGQPAKDAGLICDSDSSSLAGYLGCLQGVSNASGTGFKRVQSQFYSHLTNLDTKIAGPRLEIAKFEEGLDLSVTGDEKQDRETANNILAKRQILENRKNQCNLPQCTEVWDKVLDSFDLYTSSVMNGAAAGLLFNKFKDHHGIPNDVAWARCDVDHSLAPKVVKHDTVKTKAPEDPIAKLFKGEDGKACNFGIPRVVCNTKDAFNPRNAARAGADDPMVLITPAITGVVRNDLREFMINNYLSGWKAEASRTLGSHKLKKATQRMKNALNCSSSGVDLNSFTPQPDAAAQREGQLQGAIAAACVGRLTEEFTVLQAKHGKGVKVQLSADDLIKEYVDTARRNMTSTGRKAFDTAEHAAGFAEMGIYLTPVVGQIYPLVKMVTKMATNTPLANLRAAYAEKNKCAGMYPVGSSLFEECRASFALMTQVGAEASSYLREFPALDDNGEKKDGPRGFQLANTKMPADVENLVKTYVPGKGGSCVDQARVALKGREDQVSYNQDGVFSNEKSLKRLAAIEHMVGKFCSDTDAKQEVDALLMSPDLLAKYFNCSEQPPYIRDEKNTFSCQERSKFAWVMCRESLRVANGPKNSSALAEAISEGLPMLMDAGMMFSRGAAIARAGLGVIGPQAVIGGAMGGIPAYFASNAQEGQSSPQAVLERERAKLAAGFGSGESVSEAQHAVTEFEAQNAAWLGEHPVLKATLQGAMMGALMGSMSGGHSVGKAVPTEQMKVRAQSLLSVLKMLEEQKAFEQKGGSKVRTAVARQLEDYLIALREDGEGKKLSEKEIKKMSPAQKRQALQAKVGTSEEPQVKTFAEAKTKLETRDPDFFRKLVDEDATAFEDVKRTVEEAPDAAVKIQEYFKTLGNEDGAIRKFFRRVARECPKDKAALMAMVKECGLTLVRL